MTDAGKITPPGMRTITPFSTGRTGPTQSVPVASPHEKFIADGKTRTRSATRPNFAADPAAAATNGATRSGCGRWAAFGIAAVLVGGALGAGIQASNAPIGPDNSAITVTQSINTTSEQRHELRDLDLLQKVGQREGGGLEKSVFLGFHTHATVAQAFQELSQGNTISWAETKDATPHEIHNTDELRELTQNVREQETKRQIQEGVDQIRRGIDDAGRSIQDGLDQFGRSIGIHH